MIGIPTKSEEHSLPHDIPNSNYVPLTPPGSIKSVKSSPTNTINELSLIPVQQNFLPFPTTNVTEMNPISNQYCPSQWFPYPRKIIADSSYHLHRLLTTAPTQYYMIPSNLISANILPMACSSILPETVVSTPDKKNARRRREKSMRKSKIIQRSDEGSFNSKSLTTDISAHKKRKHKHSNIKDIRTKKQLRRITRQNRLAILKFMLRKRKQQKQQSISISPLPDKQMTSESLAIPIVKPEEMKTNLPDIIAPSLKITFDPTQKIESIVLFYHRRRKPDLTSENSLKLLNATDNRLDLLVEAVDFLETQQGHLNLTSYSNQ